MTRGGGHTTCLGFGLAGDDDGGRSASRSCRRVAEGENGGCVGQRGREQGRLGGFGIIFMGCWFVLIALCSLFGLPLSLFFFIAYLYIDMYN